MGRRAIALALLALGTGCYSTPQPTCAFRCGDGGDCPSGYSCGQADQVCHLVVNGQLAACATTLDAPVTTADSAVSQPDAPPVGQPDGPPSQPDSRMASQPDARSPPDAPAAIDAPPPAIDAPDIDAP